MRETQRIIDGIVYKLDEKNDHEEYYYYAEDKEGSLYTVSYGTKDLPNGEQDWVITYYENVETLKDYSHIDVKYYYKLIRSNVERLDDKQSLKVRANKYDQLASEWYRCIEDKEDTIFFLRKCREIIEDIKPETRKSRM